jgi:hypothetical protein
LGCKGFGAVVRRRLSIGHMGHFSVPPLSSPWQCSTQSSERPNCRRASISTSIPRVPGLKVCRSICAARPAAARAEVGSCPGGPAVLVRVPQCRGRELETRRHAGASRLERLTGRIIGIEALIRWKPQDARAAHSGRVHYHRREDRGYSARGHWVFEEACQQLKLELELTESVLMEATQRHSNTLERLRQLGTKITIDDFGTGYSSLKYLTTYSVNRLKLSPEFVFRVTVDNRNAAVVRHPVRQRAWPRGDCRRSGDRGPGALPDGRRLRAGAGLFCAGLPPLPHKPPRQL